MRINFTIFSTKLTGGTRVVMELCNGLAAKGHDMSIITFGKPEDNNWISLRAQVYYANRTIFQKIFGRLYLHAFGWQPFPEEQTRQLLEITPECDVNIATISYSGFAVYRSKKGVPFHFYMHYEPYVREEGYKKIIIKESYYLPTKKIVNSSWLASKIKEEIGQEVVGMVFPAVNHKIFYPRKKEKRIENGRPIRIISLAKDKWWKGFPDALKTIEIVRKRGYEVSLEVFGNSFDTRKLSPEVKNIKFNFVGTKVNESLALFYDCADILVSASYFESFPLPPIEAMACGTPVVTTPYGTEDYAFDRETALVVEAKQPDRMAEAIIELIENNSLYQKLRTNGINMAKKFTWDKAVNDLENILKKELEKNA